MPELPEVETIKRGLENNLINQTISSVQCHRDTLRHPIPKKLDTLITRKKMIYFARRGKYILIGLNNQQTILIHLGMSGKMIVRPNIDGEPIVKHEHLTLITKEGQRLSYIDPRRFGMIDLFKSEQTHGLLSKMGPEPLGDEAHQQFLILHLQKHLQHKKQSIKVSLLDQHIIAGLGNIYVCEALFLAGISPIRESKMLDKDEIKKIVGSIQTILTQAIEAGGSSMRDYVHANGKKGYFQMQWKVYGKEGDYCSDCLTKQKKSVIKRVVQTGRSSFYCDLCQK
ncbi:Formamidopyrimidine-DNA glycosylase (Nei) (PDB:1EE8) [Commensalibacter communis]|uniref:bifunctional DNA-formamidopyrimidine glycosylase/DNA-(apurinic or apyrimidinic site) lyase n=1 Tax=Commensalibacter communis TaxID=2972786 RepID=UPI0022FF5998|nr:bifunctional DNA-formamidopyrimidine glycosylase/DNA-(apurinic or apyrimidinic site) lyase [Commensalibacter communis]CAI3923957.1 Formamidopyrimidine-DNA glycosylase (Nei) (PDB:1EE8) [Commensalibacter communis]CAI3935192.1 Formamidopyrimidine-DNA glycosylase (Nei) (PDB:1EE8) [Commensalibacter communis]